MLKIWGLYVKGLQSNRQWNFENDSTPGILERRLSGSSEGQGHRQTLSGELQLWQLVTLKRSNLQIPYLQN